MSAPELLADAAALRLLYLGVLVLFDLWASLLLYGQCTRPLRGPLVVPRVREGPPYSRQPKAIRTKTDVISGRCHDCKKGGAEAPWLLAEL